MSFTDLKKKRPSASFIQDEGTKLRQNDAKDSDLHANLYTSLPSTVEIRSLPAHGRGLWAKTDLHPGQVLFSVKPHVAVLSTQNLETCCSACFASPLNLKRCTECQIIRYCDATCQNADWRFHKQECVALQRWEDAAPNSEASIPNDAIRCTGRMIWMMQKKGLESLFSMELNNMQSHRGSLPTSSYELVTGMAQALVQYLGAQSLNDLAEFGLSSIGGLVDLVSRFTTNSFTVTDPSLTPLGVSVSPLVALINHSCDPNAVVVFPRVKSAKDEPCMLVVALKEISPGEEILTAYIDTTLPRDLRQKSLQETYNFTCKCTLCESPIQVDPRSSLHCPKRCPGTCPAPENDTTFPRCIECKAAITSPEDIIDVIRVGQEALDKATALRTLDPAKSRQLTTKLIPILSTAGLCPSSHPLLALSRLHLTQLLDDLNSGPPSQESLDECVRGSTRVVTGLSTILPPGHPVLGIATAELGKLLAVDEPEPWEHGALKYPPSGPQRLQLAYNTLLRAHEMLLIGFGKENEGGQVGKQVRETLVSLENELGTWKQGIKNVLQDTPRVRPVA